MNEREFYDLCYDQYKHEQNQADAIYTRAGVLLPSLPVLGAIAYGLGRPELLVLCFTRIEIFSYLFGAILAFGCMGVSVLFLLLCLYPRRYQSLPPMADWEDWRQNFRTEFRKNDSEPDEEQIGEHCLGLLKEKVVAAQKDYARLNEIRRKHFQRAILLAALAICGIALEAFFHLFLHLQGV